MDRKSLSEARVILGGIVDTHDIAMSPLDDSIIFKIYNNLLFHTMVLHFRTFAQLYRGDINDIHEKLLSVPGENFVFALQAAEDSTEIDKNSYGIITVIPPSWVNTSGLEVVDIYSSLNIVDANTQHAYDVVIGFLRKLNRLQEVVRNLASENLSVRILDSVFPQNVLSKLNPNWKDIPLYVEKNNFSQFHVTLFKDAFKDLLAEASTDDGLAILLY